MLVPPYPEGVRAHPERVDVEGHRSQLQVVLDVLPPDPASSLVAEDGALPLRPSEALWEVPLEVSHGLHRAELLVGLKLVPGAPYVVLVGLAALDVDHHLVRLTEAAGVAAVEARHDVAAVEDARSWDQCLSGCTRYSEARSMKKNPMA